MWEGFIYRDVSFMFEKDNGEFGMAKWERVSNIEEWINANPNKASYFQSVQSFGISEKKHGEVHWCPFFIDLDSDEDVSAALGDTRKITDYYLQGFDTEPKVWFSGNRGFHIEIPGMVYGAEPHKHLTYHWHHLVYELVSKLELTTVDEKVYSVPRLWRIENTTHHKTGFYKTRLAIRELSDDVSKIQDLSRNAREYSDEGDNLAEDGQEADTEIETIQLLSDRYKKAVVIYEDRQKVTEEQIDAPYDFEDDPPCVRYLLSNGLAELGTKNKADMALAGYFKDSGKTLTEALTFIDGWARRIAISDTHVADAGQRVTQSIRVVRTVYAGAQYHFSCGSMRQCGDVCDEPNCKVQRHAVEVDISDYAKADYMGKRISIEADAIGRNKDMLLVPASITAICRGKSETKGCLGCGLGEHFTQEEQCAKQTIIFNARNARTLELIGSARYTIYGRFRHFFGVPDRCAVFDPQVEWENAQVVHLASRVSAEFKIEQIVTRLTCMFLGHDLKLNHGYKFTGYVWPKPTSLAAVFIADSVEPLQSTLSTFTLRKDKLKELEIFQPSKDQTPFDKVAEIHKAFKHNFMYIYGRDDLYMAMDLVFHSVRWMHFQKQTIKGWLDALVIGDTGQAKTHLAKGFMKYYNLGVMAAGETASRTGLAFAIQMLAGEAAWVAFGLLARANGYLVVVDEAHGISPADFRQLTLIRSEGIIDVKMVAWGQAAAEVRVIWIMNAKTGMSLGSYGYPVMAIPDIPALGAYEDIRRFDFAIGLVADRLDDAVLNQDVYELEKIDNPYTTEKCRNLILWLWTLGPEQVKISKRTENYILHEAISLSANYIPNIPLIEPADTKQKILRIAAAFAGRTFNSPDGKKLVIENKHVDAAIKFIHNIYTSPDLDYAGYSDDNMTIQLTAEQMAARKATFIMSYPRYREISHVILNANIFNKTHLKGHLELSTKDLDGLLAFLLNANFVLSMHNGYIKTPSGKRFLRSLIDTREVHQSELDIDDVPEEVKTEDDF